MTVRLVDCRKGDRVRIVRIETGRGPAFSLISLGLDVGHTVDLLRCSPFHGPILVSHGGTEIAIGYDLAEKILVEKE